MRYGFAALIFLLTLARLFLGIEITDESAYVANMWTFILDEGHLFKSDLFPQGASGVPVAPLTWLFKALFESEGLVLFARLLYLAWSTLAAWCAYRFLRGFYDRNWAALAALFFLSFIPFAVGSWSYNNIGSLGVPIALFSLLHGGRSSVFLGSIAAILCCFCYPPLTIVFGALLGSMWLGWFPVSRETRKFFTAMILSGGVLSAVFSWWSAGENLSSVMAMSRAFAWGGGFAKVKAIASFFIQGVANNKLWLLPLIFLPFFRRFDLALTAFFLVLAHFSLVAAHEPVSWLIYAPLVLLAIQLAQGRRQISHPEWYSPLLAFGFLAALVFGYTSSNTLINASLGMIVPLSILTLELLKEFRVSGRAREWQALALLVAINAYFVAGNYRHFYREHPMAMLDTQVENGPFRFLITTQARARFAEEVDRDIKRLSENRRSIFAAYLTPAYFSTDLSPVTGMLFIHDTEFPEAIARLVLHRTLEDGEWPDLVITRKQADPNFSYQFEKFFMSSGRYKLELERPDYRILARTQ